MDFDRMADRFLQGALGPGASGFAPAAAAARVLAADASLAERYRRVLSLYYGLTNPSHDYDAFALAQAGGDQPRSCRAIRRSKPRLRARRA